MNKIFIRELEAIKRSLLSSPLLIGCDLRNMPATTLELVTNPYLLSMNQNARARRAEPPAGCPGAVGPSDRSA